MRATPAVTAVRAAFGRQFILQEMHRAGAAFSTAAKYFYIINKIRFFQNKPFLRPVKNGIFGRICSGESVWYKKRLFLSDLRCQHFEEIFFFALGHRQLGAVAHHHITAIAFYIFLHFVQIDEM